MKLIILLSALMLSACVSVPVERKFPKVPAELQQSCPALTTIDSSTTKLSTVVDTVVTNYGQYRECQVKTDSWIEWYNEQKKIFESVK
jgi:starvation-inducible outer membrane lipoprotein